MFCYLNKFDFFSVAKVGEFQFIEDSILMGILIDKKIF